MRFKPLFPLVDAPYPDSLLDEPFHYERRLVGPAAQTVEHEYQQDVEASLLGVLLHLLELVPVIGADLEAGHARLLLFQYDFPAHLPGEVPARFPLDRNIRLIAFVMVHLLRGGHTV